VLVIISNVLYVSFLLFLLPHRKIHYKFKNFLAIVLNKHPPPFSFSFVLLTLTLGSSFVKRFFEFLVFFASLLLLFASCSKYVYASCVA